MDEQRIVVIGDSYSAYAAFYFIVKNITKIRHEVNLLLICKKDYFFFNELLPEVLLGSMNCSGVVQNINDLEIVRAGVSYLCADISSIDFDANLVRTNKGNINYKYLILAPDCDYEISKVTSKYKSSNCFQIKNLKDVIKLKEHISQNLELTSQYNLEKNKKKSSLNISVIGNNTQTIETACSISDFVNHAITTRYPGVKKSCVTVNLITENQDITTCENIFFRNKLFYNLNKKHIKVFLDSKITCLDDQRIELHNGKVISSNTNIFCDTFESPSIIKNLPLAKDKSYLACVDLYLKAEGYENVFVIGNFSRCLDTVELFNLNSIDLNKQARVCANNVISSINNNPLFPIKLTSDIKIIFLGYRNCLLYIRGFSIDGLISWLICRLIFVFLFLGLKKKFKALAGLVVSLFGLNEPDLVNLYPGVNKEDKVITMKS